MNWVLYIICVLKWIVMILFRYLYTLFYILMMPFVLLRLWWKGRSMPAYRARILERLSLDRMAPCPVDIWVHAVSLGEVIAITPLIEQYLSKNKRILVTTMTPTGSNRVREQFGERVIHRYVPYELPFALRRFFKTFKPTVGVIVETELWPNLIHFAHKSNVCLLLFNARLSEKSCRGYFKLIWFFKPLLNQFYGIHVQTEADAARFKTLGADPRRVHVTGNIKFDLTIKQINFEPFVAIKSFWGAKRVIVIAASTHENEEQQLLNCLRRLQEKIPQVLFLIAPRHPERFEKVHQLACAMGFNTGLRSDTSTLNEHNDVVILDCLGELLGFFHISDYAFIGGSLVPVGGHNMLEPIAMGVPVLTGPFVYNFLAICQSLLAVEGIIQISTATEFVDNLSLLHDNEAAKAKLCTAASQVLHANQGALQRYLIVTEEVLAQ